MALKHAPWSLLTISSSVQDVFQHHLMALSTIYEQFSHAYLQMHTLFK